MSLNHYQRALLRAHGKAKMHCMSFVVLTYVEPEKYYSGEIDYIVVSCEEAMISYRNSNIYQVVKWMHPNIIPDWDEYDISEEDFSEYMHKRFPVFYNMKSLSTT